MAGFYRPTLRTSQRLQQHYSASAAGVLAPINTGSLHDEILADAPAFYYRHAEASGLVMVEEGSSANNGMYNAFGGGGAALYTGGPASTDFTGNKQGYFTGTIPALTSLSLVAVVKLSSTSSYQPVGLNRDENAGGRKYQFRSNGTQLEFVKIAGGVVTAGAPSVFVADTVVLIGVTISVVGAIKLYKNGVLQTTTASDAADYGGAGDRLAVGYTTGISAGLNGFQSESALFATELTAGRMLAYAVAAGLA